MRQFLKAIFFIFFVKPLVYIVIGLNVKHSDRLPKSGPAILVANHTSHMDTLILMSLFPINTILKIQPIAARDYFFKTKFRAWVSMNLIGIIPLDREQETFSGIHPFAPVTEALKEDKIVIIYPEGTRGTSDNIGEFKSGVAHLAKQNPEVPVIPIYVHNPDMVLPKGDGLLVPFICDVFIGETMKWNKNKELFMTILKSKIEELKIQCSTRI